VQEIVGQRLEHKNKIRNIDYNVDINHGEVQGTGR